MTDGIIDTWTMGHLQDAWSSHGRHRVGVGADWDNRCGDRGYSK